MYTEMQEVTILLIYKQLRDIMSVGGAALIQQLLIFPVLFSFLYQLCFVNKINLKYFTLRSTCDYCHRSIKLYDMIPIFSFILLRGKSRCCNKKLNYCYLLGEVLALLPAFYFHFIPSNKYFENPTFLLIFLFLLVFSLFDITTYTLPLHMLIILLLTSFYITQIKLFPFLIVTTILHLFFFINRNAIGYGDILLLSILSLIIPFDLFRLIFLLSFIIGGCFALFLLLITRNLKCKLPFIPFVFIAYNIAFCIYHFTGGYFI